MCLDNIDVGVFCGGLGTRLNYPDLPKALAPINGKPFLEELMTSLEAAGASKIVLMTGHLAEQILEFVAARDSTAEIVLDHRKPEGATAALRQAAPLFTSDRVLLTNGDTWLTSDICRFVRSGQTRELSVLWTRNSETTFIDDSGFRLFSRHALQQAAMSPDYETFVRMDGYPIVMPGQFLDIGTPQRLAMAQAG